MYDRLSIVMFNNACEHSRSRFALVIIKSSYFVSIFFEQMAGNVKS